jgi:uroporphyrinogen-III decarboxylase
MMKKETRTMPTKPENWAAMTPEERRSWRLENFRNSGRNVSFVSPQAEKNFRTRVKRLIDVYNLKEPDRVPLSVMAGNLPLKMAGLDARASFYEPDKACEAAMKFNERYAEEIEAFTLPMQLSGQFMEALDYKLYGWPGHGLADSAGGWQFIEGEYMMADEYDDLIRDPSDFWLRKYLPRVVGAFRPFTMFQPFTTIIENVHLNTLGPFSQPAVQDMFRTFIKAGEAYAKAAAATRPYFGQAAAHGFPAPFGMLCFAPFDVLGDTLRGTTNIMKDMFRQPEKLLAALEVIADVTISNVLNSPGIDNFYMISYPLHKGADGWMSRQQFETFYWPSFKRVLEAFINEGLIQSLFAEGGYNTRLEYVNDFPRGTVTWRFDQTDMAKAKELLGKDCCVQGNVPTSLLVTSTPDKVKEYCKNVIETCKPGGGFVLCPGAGAENPRLENLKAMAEAVNEYGWYR